MKNGVKLIAQERNRQIKKEGYTKEHDAQHQQGQLSIAAACYALNKLPCRNWGGTPLFPWQQTYHKLKKHDRKRSLVIAGALIAAELDRIIAEESAGKK